MLNATKSKSVMAATLCADTAEELKIAYGLVTDPMAYGDSVKADQVRAWEQSARAFKYGTRADHHTAVVQHELAGNARMVVLHKKFSS